MELQSAANVGVRVRVRMYRQGLGDCFLLSFSTDTRSFHMLVDCGVFRGTEGAKEKMNAVAENIKLATEPDGLDVLVATHQHWDHLSGFLQAREVFDRLGVGSVWVAWTEDPNNPVARRLKETQATRLQALTNVVTKKKFDAIDPGMRQGISEILGFFGENDLGVTGSITTKQALDYVMGKAKAHFCVPGKEPIALAELPGIRFYILGPPQDPVLLKRSNPSRGDSKVYEANLGLDADAAFLAATQPDYQDSQGYVPASVDEDRQWHCFPFDRSYRISLDRAKRDSFFSSRYFESAFEYRKIGSDWLNWSQQLALNLDNDTNNTSLAFAIELIASKKVILFPADAQVGNWLSWSSLSWTIREANREERKVTANDLLQRTVLYKVGHHGSHNATLREKGLELMSSPDLVAMIPVDAVFAQAPPRHWKMPFEPLYDRLSEKCKGRVLRADRTWPRNDAAKPDALSDTEWERFKKSVVVDLKNLYIDITVS
jgi:hypothetical protein